MREGLVGLLAGAIALAGVPGIAYSQEVLDAPKQSASHTIFLEIKPFIQLVVNQDKITEIYLFGNVPEDKIVVWRGKSGTRLTDKSNAEIRTQYLDFRAKNKSRDYWDEMHYTHFMQEDKGWIAVIPPEPESEKTNSAAVYPDSEGRFPPLVLKLSDDYTKPEQKNFMLRERKLSPEEIFLRAVGIGNAVDITSSEDGNTLYYTILTR